jgi:hypothetical protein
MATGNDIVEEVKRLAMGTQSEEMNKLANNFGPDATELFFSFDLGGIRAGTQIEIDTEMFRVWTVDSGWKSAAVEPGYAGTTSAVHSIGSLVYVNPRFPRSAIFRALNNEITALSSPTNGLYRMATVDFTYSVNQSMYDLTAVDQLLDIYDVNVELTGGLNHWLPVKDWRYARSADSTDFPSGHGIYLPSGEHGRTVRINYKAPFSQLADLDDDLVAVAGIPEEMHDILTLGVLLRIGPAREVSRNFTESQGDARRAEEVGAGSITNSFRYLQAQYQERINQEAARLMQMYPPIR